MTVASLATRRGRTGHSFRLRTQVHGVPAVELRRVALSAAGSNDSRSTNCSSSSSAIVATVKGFGQLAISWCDYHLAIGFDHLFIYFDDPSELQAVSSQLYALFPANALTLVPHNASLRKAWASLPGTKELLPHAAAEVQVRQQLNARHALQLAVRHGLHWLLHIDADELFDPGGGNPPSVRNHFAELEVAGVETFCYMNFEAVPEKHGISDPFKEVTLFKRCYELIPRTDAACAAVDLWQARHRGCFFYYYDNGKACVRVRPNARPLSVHEWLPGTAEGMQHWRSNMRDPWHGRGNLDQVVQFRQSSARILHYPVYSYLALWQRYLGGNDRYTLAGRETPPPFHHFVLSEAHEACKRSGSAAAEATIRRVFEQKVMLLSEEDVSEQIDAAVCERIRGPQRLLASLGRQRK